MKPSPQALVGFLLDPRQGSLPLQPQALFGRQAPLKVEVGFGGGEYLAWWSGEEPQHDFLGIELPPDCLHRAARRLDQVARANVRLIQGDARYLLRSLFAPASLREVLMQFPMPWPKEKHAKHRVSSPAFTSTLATVLEPGGRFQLLTDQPWYAEDCHAHFSADADFSVLEMEKNPERPFRTRYERKWLAEGRSIYRLTVRLDRSRFSPDPLAPSPMEHLHLTTAPLAETVAALVGRRFREGSCSAEVKALFQAEDGWLLRVVAADEAFAQMFHLRLRRREDQRWLLEVDGLPRPYYTAAVRFLQREVAQALQRIDA